MKMCGEISKIRFALSMFQRIIYIEAPGDAVGRGQRTLLRGEVFQKSAAIAGGNLFGSARDVRCLAANGMPISIRGQ